MVNILKLVIKEVIESSLRFGRQLDSDHIPLHHFFIVLEHVLRHGLKPKKVSTVTIQNPIHRIPKKSEYEISNRLFIKKAGSEGQNWMAK